MLKQTKLVIAPLSLLLIIQLTPVSVRAWDFESGELIPVVFPTGTSPVTLPDSADLDLDGTLETLIQAEGSLTIHSGNQTAWISPPGWEVVQSAFTDLNRDSIIEAALLVWRPFEPWPVDKFLPYGGRIAGFHDGGGYSCHLILIGWTGDGYGELWAGSALADPITTFAAIDLDEDAAQELITLEGRYTFKGSSPALTMKIWRWNGFGFSVVSHVEGKFTSLALSREESGRILILTP
jgi:hypothetical protein